MSFSSEVKEELSRHLGKSRHCQIAELAALIAFDGKVQVSESGCDLFLDSENELLRLRFQDITHPEDLETDLEIFKKLSKKQIKSYQHEKRYQLAES